MLLGQAIVLLVEEVVAEAGGVQEQHAGGDGALGRPQPGLAGGVEALQDLGLADLRCVFLGRGVEVEPALLDQLQDGCAGDRLGGREDREHGIRGHVGVLAEHPLAGRALVDVATPVGRHCDHPRDPRSARDGSVQDRVGGVLQLVGHRLPPYGSASEYSTLSVGWAAWRTTCSGVGGKGSSRVTVRLLPVPPRRVGR